MFTTSKCGHCGKYGTKLSEIEPNGSQYKQNAVCCTSCNSILGIVGYYDAGSLLKKQEAQINEMVRQIGALTQSVTNLQRELQSLRRG